MLIHALQCFLLVPRGNRHRNLKSPFKTFRLLVQLRRGRHPQISCCKGTCFLQSLSKVSKSLLLHPAIVTMVAQKSGSCSSEFGLPKFCQEVLYPGEVLHETGGGWKQGSTLRLGQKARRQERLRFADDQSMLEDVSFVYILCKVYTLCTLYTTTLFSLHIFNC